MPHWFIDRDERHIHAQKYKQAYQMICGAASGAITKTATAPLERVKILLQLQGMSGALKGLPPSSNILQVIAYMWKEDGVRGLFKGNGANVARVIPVYALKFSFNERFRDLVRTPGQRDHHLSFVQLISAGTLAGLTQIVITYPLELIRTRLSLSNNTTSVTQTGKYNGMIDCAVKTVRVEGVRALYKGFPLVSCVFSSCSACTMCFVVGMNVVQCLRMKPLVESEHSRVQ